MLPRRASSANLCFSCQLRLLRSPCPSLSSSPTLLPYKNQLCENPQNLQQRRQFSYSQSRRGSIRPVRIRTTSWQKEKEKLRASQDLSGNQIGVYGRPGRQVLGESVPLGDIERLGTPSNVIVLREGSFWSPDHVPRQRAPALRPPDQEMGILEAVKAETGLVMQSDVNANINELRPKDPKGPLTEKEFQRIGKILENGFTNSQLYAYIRAYPKKEPDLTSKTDWYPNISKRDQLSEKHPLRGYLSIQHNTKQRLVLDILRTCWELDVKEVVESVGRIELHLKVPEIQLVTHPSISPLGPILAKLYHSDGERIDAFKSRKVLRITASRKRAFEIANEIEKRVFDRIENVPINLSILKSIRKTRNIDRSNEDEYITAAAPEVQIFELMKAKVSEMTGTTIHCARIMAVIFGINESPNLQLASPHEIARRLIISYYTQSNSVIPRTGLRPAHSSATEALVRYDDVDCLPWYDRLRQWVRRTTATSKSTLYDFVVQETISSKEEHSPASDAIEQAADDSEIHVEPSPTSAQRHGAPSSSNIWRTEYHISSDVMLGQVLHEKPNATAIEILHDREKLRISENQTFSTTVPNLPTLMESWRADNGGTPAMSESVVLQFEPSPHAKDWKLSQALPPVEMRFGIDEIDSMTRSLHLKDVKAFIRKTTSDVMVPSRPVDLRFQQRTTSSLVNISVKDAKEKSAAMRISKFLKASELNLVTGIKTPSTLILPIELHMCKEPTAWGNRPGTKTGKGKPKKDIDIEYIFSGMEIRKKMQFDFKGWTLIYTDISAGKAGGRRREVRLLPERTDSKTWSQEDFIKAAFELADVAGGQKSKTLDVAEIKWHPTEDSGRSEFFSEELVPGKHREADEVD